MSVTTPSNKVEIKIINTFIPVLKCKNNGYVTITIHNTSGTDLHSLIIKDNILKSEKYVPNSLIINGQNKKGGNPGKGIQVDRLDNYDLLYEIYRRS